MVLICEWNSCNLSYADAGKLYHHLAETHCAEQDENATEWPCHWKGCNVSVDRKYRLTSHLLTHTPYRPYSCKFCQKTFKRSHDMKKHIRLSHPSNADDANSIGSDSISMDESLDTQITQRQMMSAMQQMQHMRQLAQGQQVQGGTGSNPMQQPHMPSSNPIPTHVAMQRGHFAPQRPIQQMTRPQYQEPSPEPSRHVRLGSFSAVSHDAKYDSMVQKFLAYTPPAR